MSNVSALTQADSQAFRARSDADHVADLIKLGSNPESITRVQAWPLRR